MKAICNPTKSRVAFGSMAATPELPLTPDETVNLQEIYTSLNHLYVRLSSINEGVQERVAASLRQSPCNNRAGNAARTKEEAIAGYLCLNGIAGVNPDEIELGHEDSPGPMGCNPHDPIGAILMYLSNVKYKIEMLIHKESLQTTSIHKCLPSFPHLSDDGSIHGQIDKSIDTNNPP